MTIQNDILVTNPDLLLEKDEERVFNALGYLKVFVNAMHSGKNLQEVTGIEKAVDVFNTQGRIVGYSTFTGYLCTSIAKQIKNSSSLSTANDVLNATNSVAFGALYALAAIQNSYQLAEDHNLSDFLKEKDAVVLKGLIQNLHKPLSNHLGQLKASWNKLTPQLQESKKQQFKQKIQKSALEEVKTQTLALQLPQKDLEKLLKDLQTPLTQEQSNELSNLLGLSDQDYWQFNPLEVVGLIIDQHKTKTRNWTQLKEKTSLQAAQAVDKAYRRGLSERIKSDDPVVKAIAKIDMKQLIGRVRVESSQTKRIHTALLTINLLGAAMSVIGIVTLPFGIGIAITALSFLVTMASIGSRAYLLKKDLLDTPCGKYDKAFVITIAVLLGLSLVALTGVTLVFGLSLIQLGVALGVGGLLGGGFLGYYYHLLGQKDKLWKEAHPSLEVFQNFILEKIQKKEGWDKEVHDLFKKLPKDLRKAISQEYEKKDLPNNLTTANEISAFKKTSKHFWNQWLISGSEEARKLALEVQSAYDSLRLNKQDLEKLQSLRNVENGQTQPTKKELLQNQRVKEQLEKDSKYIFYRKNSLRDYRKNSLRDLYEVTNRASQKILAKPLSSSARLRQSG